MEILEDDDVWKPTCDCVKCDGQCPTPIGLACSRAHLTSELNQLDWFVGGTVCVDVSMMGNRMALLGESSISLALFLACIKKAKPAGVTHECTSFFSQFLFDEFLPEYQVHRIAVPKNQEQRSALKAGFQSGTWLLSPHQMGWPCFRPRHPMVFD